MQIDNTSLTWKTVSAHLREQAKKQFKTLLTHGDWEAVRSARAVLRAIDGVLKLDPDYKKPEWSEND